MKISNHITKQQGAELRENYIRTFGAEAWEKLQAREKELKTIEMANK